MSEDSVNHNYFFPLHIATDKNISKLDLIIYSIISSFIFRTNSCFGSNAWFATKAQCDERSVRKCLERLESLKYIQRKNIDGKRYIRPVTVPLICTDNDQEEISKKHTNSTQINTGRPSRARPDPTGGGGPTPPVREERAGHIYNKINKKDDVCGHSTQFSQNHNQNKAAILDRCRDQFDNKFEGRDITIEKLFDDHSAYANENGKQVTERTFSKWIEREHVENYQKRNTNQSPIPTQTHLTPEQQEWIGEFRYSTERPGMWPPRLEPYQLEFCENWTKNKAMELSKPSTELKIPPNPNLMTTETTLKESNTYVATQSKSLNGDSYTKDVVEDKPPPAGANKGSIGAASPTSVATEQAPNNNRTNAEGASSKEVALAMLKDMKKILKPMPQVQKITPRKMMDRYLPPTARYENPSVSIHDYYEPGEQRVKHTKSGS